MGYAPWNWEARDGHFELPSMQQFLRYNQLKQSHLPAKKKTILLASAQLCIIACTEVAKKMSKVYIYIYIYITSTTNTLNKKAPPKNQEDLFNQL